MIINKRKIGILMTLGGLILAFSFFIFYLFNNIKKESENFIFQKKISAELKVKSEALEKFQVIHKKYYQLNLEKINKLFINLANPIDFIEFLEKEAVASHLLIEIIPLNVSEGEESDWLYLDFQLILNSSFPDFLKFFKRIETSPYLIEVLSLNIRKTDKEIPCQVKSILLIRVYAK